MADVASSSGLAKPRPNVERVNGSSFRRRHTDTPTELRKLASSCITYVDASTQTDGITEGIGSDAATQTDMGSRVDARAQSAEITQTDEVKIDDTRATTTQEDNVSPTESSEVAEQELTRVDDGQGEPVMSTEAAATVQDEVIEQVGCGEVQNVTVRQLATLGAGEGETVPTEVAHDASHIPPAPETDVSVKDEAGSEATAPLLARGQDTLAKLPPPAAELFATDDVDWEITDHPLPNSAVNPDDWLRASEDWPEAPDTWPATYADWGDGRFNVPATGQEKPASSSSSAQNNSPDDPHRSSSVTSEEAEAKQDSQYQKYLNMFHLASSITVPAFKQMRHPVASFLFPALNKEEGEPGSWTHDDLRETAHWCAEGLRLMEEGGNT
jgi:hypothetical protein